MEYDPKVVAALIAALAAIIIAVVQLYYQSQSLQAASAKVLEAEDQAFVGHAAELEAKLETLGDSQEGLNEEERKRLSQLIEESHAAVAMGRLFNLYSKQIEKYQRETRARATWSFVFAIVAMLSGFGFVIWGGTVLLNAQETIVLAAGGLLSTVGGTISGFITKTFMDVHRLSLTQLNTYFRQPVINDHILMAQRLADRCDDAETRKQAYGRIIDSITSLINKQIEPEQDG